MSAESVAEQLKRASEEYPAKSAAIVGFMLGIIWERNKRKRRKKADTR